MIAKCHFTVIGQQYIRVLDLKESFKMNVEISICVVDMREWYTVFFCFFSKEQIRVLAWTCWEEVERSRCQVWCWLYSLSFTEMVRLQYQYYSEIIGQLKYPCYCIERAGPYTSRISWREHFEGAVWKFFLKRSSNGECGVCWESLFNPKVNTVFKRKQDVEELSTDIQGIECTNSF